MSPVWPATSASAANRNVRGGTSSGAPFCFDGLGSVESSASKEHHVGGHDDRRETQLGRYLSGVTWIRACRRGVRLPELGLGTGR